jgi:hypothetical protein
VPGSAFSSPRIKATRKVTARQVAIILPITGDVVTRFQMLEDSFGVSKAAGTWIRHRANRQEAQMSNPRRIMWCGTVRAPLKEQLRVAAIARCEAMSVTLSDSIVRFDPLASGSETRP